MDTAPKKSVVVERSNWTRDAGLSRRSLLRRFGASAAVAPLFAPFVPWPSLEAFAAPAAPRRLVLWFTPHGTIWEKWRTGGTPAAPTLGPILSPLERHKANLIIPEGMRVRADGVGAPHTKGPPLLWTGSKLKEDMTFTRGDGSGGMYYGWNTGPSVDQVIIQTIKPATPFPSLEFGVRSGGSHPGSRMIYQAAEKPLSPESDPQRAFTRLFGDTSQSVDKLKTLTEDRHGVLGLVNQELTAFKGKVSAADRLKIESHLAAIGSIEKRLLDGAKACAVQKPAPVVDSNQSDNQPATFDEQIDLLAVALGCGLTNFASMQYRVGENDGGYLYKWLGLTTQEHHLLTHSADNDGAGWGMAEKIYTWYAERFARFLDKLAALPENGGSVLDNTIVVWGSEIGKGNNHSFDNVPFVIAGGRNMGLQPGRAMRFAGGVDHSRLLVSLCQIMGASAINTFGNNEKGTGPLPGLIA
ncbi:MAG: DUF1552 domain-containing protein [Deltaproteobacteria bacterium]|mgnify:CR=1 FL=1|nr:DUF1552 domain-containing protein [Deltaproteobacteria bacterium]